MFRVFHGKVNLEMLKGCWPEVWEELVERYNAPGGYLKGELKNDEVKKW